jgi:protein phosphatase
VTVVVVDILPAVGEGVVEAEAKYVGAAENEIVIEERKGRKSLGLLNPRVLVDIFKPSDKSTDFQPESDELLDKFQRETVKKLRWRKVRQLATIVLLVAGVGVGVYFGYEYTQTKYYVAESNGKIAIFKGIREELGPIKFSRVVEETEYDVAELPEYQRGQIEASIFATSLEDAERIIGEVLKAAENG